MRDSSVRGPQPVRWQLPIGATVLPDAVAFRVWAPTRQQVEVVLSDTGTAVPMVRDSHGYFSTTLAGVRAGALYTYRLDGGALRPDPCARFQPHGPHEPSMVIDPVAYAWHDSSWPGITLPGQVIYELHVGTFTADGTLDAAARELAELRRLGVTLVELMPIAEFPGRWNWGYDGVGLYAPSHLYGDPHALKRFVDHAHAQGIGVLLDVVYNHLGPDGNYLREFSESYFTDRYTTDWGTAINFDGPDSGPVRAFVLNNACYWVHEFHIDGFRLDATQNIFDNSQPHVLAELSQQTRAVAGRRSIILIAENEPQQIHYVAPVAQGGYGMDALWNDDFHHAARVAVTGQREAYYADYRGTPQELLSSITRGYLYQGQCSSWHRQPRGAVVTDEPASCFVHFLQNHDQVANHPTGERLHRLTTPGRLRALTALLLLAPETPLVFMGQEFAASSPFPFFADHHAQLAPLVQAGRKKFLARFPSYATAHVQATIPDPADPATFQRSKLNLLERHAHAPVYRLHHDLLQLRRQDPVLAAQDRRHLDGAVLGPDAFILRFFDPHGHHRLLLVNLGAALSLDSAPEPLLAPAPHAGWQLIWSSDAPSYDGPGASHPCALGTWTLAAESAVVLTP